MARCPNQKIKKQREEESAKRGRRLVPDNEFVEKKKEIVQIEGGDIDIILEIYVVSTDGIDDPCHYKSVRNRWYRVSVQVEGGGEEFSSKIVAGFPDPRWDVKIYVKLDSLLTSRHVRFEVIRCYSQSDPGTSTGEILVGRTQIPIPWQLEELIGGRYGLLRPKEDGEGGYRPEGHICVQMQRSAFVRRRKPAW